ncbi:MAG TPA: methylenetetrahydrofolate--tRNA-(uracil(54)-C(5))-methyltransferase (FADH(2)-oxidizing) TrmFO [bacterium]|nr:methylenetetrahydrofolate--tRNA-(uracil(54)-C(5))-methyltransferase (FADH(2)-oxidizing) TrmFO [bacterium]
MTSDIRPPAARPVASGRVSIVGGGLAGSEAAWQAARLGAEVTLYEMRPSKMTEAHRTGLLAELVCSNSFKSDALDNANGLLKLELKMLNSLLVMAAAEARVPAGTALCVDRQAFAARVTKLIEAEPRIALVRREVAALPEADAVVLAPGPLASPAISQAIESLVGARHLFFYDAVSPIVEADSVDMSVAFSSSRYDKGESTYLNLPLDKAQYARFLCELRDAEVLPRREFEEDRFFSACMPVEESARMGEETLAHGCMKPVGLLNPRTGRMPHAVVQLRPENVAGTMYGMVGFQTRLKYAEQERILRMLPGLEHARFVRLGSIHRNTYICSPAVLAPTLRVKRLPHVFVAGQVTGAEGYMAAVATGLLAGVNAALAARGEPCLVPPVETVIGGLAGYLSTASPIDFRPLNPNYGLLPPLGIKVRDRRRRNLLLSERSAGALKTWIERNGVAGRTDMAVNPSGVIS